MSLPFFDQLYRSTTYCRNCDEHSDLMVDGVCLDCRLDYGKK